MLGGPMAEMNQLMEEEETEGGIRRTVGIINSMTLDERRDPSVISGSVERIAQGVGFGTSYPTHQTVRADETDDGGNGRKDAGTPEGGTGIA